MSLLPAERAQYSAIIDGILASGDLQTISRKQVRKGLQARLQVDISDKKEAVQKLILERFDHASNLAATPLPTTEAPPTHSNNGYIKTEENSARLKNESTPPTSTSVSRAISSLSGSAIKTSPSSDLENDISPPKKKRKPIKEDDDAKLAARLQAQENSRARNTRGGGSKKIITKKVKKPRKKSEKKVRADDDSELEVGSDGEVKEKKERKGGFHKQYYLSAALAELVGEPQLSRPQVVKKIWEHIHADNLQDQNDKRQINCDQLMQSVFKCDRVHMFTMNKLLGKHLYPIEEAEAA